MLILLSNFTDDDNSGLTAAVRRKFSSRKHELGYVPASTDRTGLHFESAAMSLKEYGNFNITVFDIDEDYDEQNIAGLFLSDIIFLSGGNTFHFLKNLRRRGLIKEFRDYCKQGGNIIGLSAGALILSDNIETAYFGDDNYDNISDLSAFGIIDFEVMPHWTSSNEYLNDLLDYTGRNKRTVITINDGDGIIIDREKIRYYGTLRKIENGTITDIAAQ